MAHHNVRISDRISYGSSNSPGFSTAVVKTASGWTQAIPRWTTPLRVYNLRYGVKSDADLRSLMEFYILRGGSTHTFLLKDWLDYSTSANPGTTAVAFDDVTLPDTGDGSTQSFQLYKVYSDGTYTSTRKITKPIASTVKVGVNGVEEASAQYTIDSTTGLVTFLTAPVNGGVITAGFEFDVPVRFASEIDQGFRATANRYNDGAANDILLEEERETQQIPDLYNYGGTSEHDFGSDLSISMVQGRVFNMTPTATGLKVLLPNPLPADGFVGGERLYFYNNSPSRTFQLADHNGTILPIINTVGTKRGGMAFVVQGSSSFLWRYVGQ